MCYWFFAHLISTFPKKVCSAIRYEFISQRLVDSIRTTTKILRMAYINVMTSLTQSQRLTFGSLRMRRKFVDLYQIRSLTIIILSFRCVVFPNEVQCIDASSATGVFKTYSNPNSATFDARPGLLKFNPVRYWFCVSTGTNIVTYVRYKPFKYSLA